MRGLFYHLSATFWRPSVRTICTPFSAFWGLSVSGFPLSKMAALGREKPLSRPFIINKLTALGTSSLWATMSPWHCYNLSACLLVVHPTCRRSAGSLQGAPFYISRYYRIINCRQCQEENEVRGKRPSSHSFLPSDGYQKTGLAVPALVGLVFHRLRVYTFCD